MGQAEAPAEAPAPPRGIPCGYMTGRRQFFQSVAGVGMAASAPQAAESDRQYWVRMLARLAEPVLRNLAAGTLKRNMPVECVTGNVADRRKYSHLEALGRLLAGIAPWLEAPLAPGAERDLQQRFAGLAREAIRSATDPGSPDFLNFHDGAQPLVDCGFLGQAILRAPGELWKKLDTGNPAAPGGSAAFRRAPSRRGLTTGCCSRPPWRPRWR